MGAVLEQCVRQISLQSRRDFLELLMRHGHSVAGEPLAKTGIAQSPRNFVSFGQLFQHRNIFAVNLSVGLSLNRTYDHGESETRG